MIPYVSSERSVFCVSVRPRLKVLLKVNQYQVLAAVTGGVECDNPGLVPTADGLYVNGDGLLATCKQELLPPRIRATCTVRRAVNLCIGLGIAGLCLPYVSKVIPHPDRDIGHRFAGRCGHLARDTRPPALPILI